MSDPATIEYLCKSGLVNPELMEPDRVRNLIIDLATKLAEAQAEVEAWQLERTILIEGAKAQEARIKELEKWLQESKDNYTRAMTESDKKVADMAVALNNALAHIRRPESEARS